MAETGPILSTDSASHRAYRALERLIVTLELAPGTLTTEGALMQQIGLGRTPVREAIQRLAWAGLLAVRARAGIEIAPLHAADWLRVIDARRGVETLLAKGAARYLTPGSAEQFQKAAHAMHAAVLNGDVAMFLVADRSLDDAIAAVAGNDFAARLAGPLQAHSRRFWFRFHSGTGLAEAAGHHVALIRAILDRDEDGAAAEADRLMALLRLHAQAAAMR